VQGELAIKQQELQLKAQELASRQGENPELAAAQMQQEMAMDRQVHEQEMAQRQSEFDQKMAQKQQEAAIKMRTKLMETLNKPAATSPDSKGE
jgi:deoxyribodipyrimidine photolyase